MYRNSGKNRRNVRPRNFKARCCVAGEKLMPYSKQDFVCKVDVENCYEVQISTCKRNKQTKVNQK